jgi:hypothetical protein
MYEIFVANIGMVWTGDSHRDAYQQFENYARQSGSGYGRAGGETVTLLLDGVIIREFLGVDA